MRIIWVWVGLLLLAGTCLAQVTTRNVRGSVHYSDGEPARNAAVQLEDMATMQIISRRSNEEGEFLFQGLPTDHDLEVTAMHKGVWSKSKRVSRFNANKEAFVKLFLNPK